MNRAPGIESGVRIYCIGDIHGRADLLSQLHSKIEKDATAFQGRIILVYLGDYIDRGEHSNEVINILLESTPADYQTEFLMGNHEQVMLAFLQDPKANRAWLSFGGLATLYSYGVELERNYFAVDVEKTANDLFEKLPQDHLAFITSCKESFSCGDYYFVHAGIRPGVGLDLQSIDDKLWIRQEFIDCQDEHELVVVHGHTISEEIEFLPNRIGLDTGAFHTGVLSCLVLEGLEQRLLQTGKDE